jgi:4-carboxymuconolactone decarboxylase
MSPHSGDVLSVCCRNPTARETRPSSDRSLLLRPRGDLLPQPASEPARAALVDQSVGPVVPALAELTNRVLFDDLWRRRDLSPRDRSVVTIAGLIAIRRHGAVAVLHRPRPGNGLTREQLAEAITHLALYAGWPRALSAVPVLAQASAS